ncbi:hypothetical protein H9649_08285 [Sporosarcina sp. Sa2YVA2]|uniref:Transposase n=1 Tax=Sporosarcina quadrami TaxID=2762234 RepID=A0ABR8U984_9BACL|nr:hypothetical protein [Sporosarcina quadrami]MBD7984575.1 hypothetical protein [Sporosarcina quadrami]
MANHNELRKEWEGRISDFKLSGQSGAGCCAANQINLQQFYYWRKRLMSEDQLGNQSPDWVTFEVGKPTIDSYDHIRVLVGEVIIEVKQGYDSNLLVNLIRILRASC